MEENEIKDAFWTPLFIVGGFSLLFFSGMIQLLQGPHAGLFLKLGVLSIVVGLISHMVERTLVGQEFHTPESPSE